MNPEPHTVRDAEHRELIENSERLREKLVSAVNELDSYVQALQAEIERKRSQFQNQEDSR